MKKLIILFLIPLFLTGCRAKFPAATAPEGWNEYSAGPVHILYPESEYLPLSQSDSCVILSNEEGTAAIEIEKGREVPENFTFLARNAAQQQDALYEEAYGLPFDTSFGEIRSETRTKGNGKCLCVSYEVETTGQLVALKMTASYYHVIYKGDKDTCIITFCIASDSGITAEEHFGDIIGKIYIE